MDQMFRVEADFEPGTLAVGRQALDTCIFKIFPQVLPDPELGKNIKKRFGHMSEASLGTRLSPLFP